MGSKYLIGYRCIATITYDVAERIELLEPLIATDRRRENAASRSEIWRQRVLQQRKQDRRKEALATFCRSASLPRSPTSQCLLLVFVTVAPPCDPAYPSTHWPRPSGHGRPCTGRFSGRPIMPGQAASRECCECMHRCLVACRHFLPFSVLLPLVRRLLTVLLVFLVSHGVVSAHKHEKYPVCDYVKSRQGGFGVWNATSPTGQDGSAEGRREKASRSCFDLDLFPVRRSLSLQFPLG